MYAVLYCNIVLKVLFCKKEVYGNKSNFKQAKELLYVQGFLHKLSDKTFHR